MSITFYMAPPTRKRDVQGAKLSAEKTGLGSSMRSEAADVSDSLPFNGGKRG